MTNTTDKKISSLPHVDALLFISSLATMQFKSIEEFYTLLTVLYHYTMINDFNELHTKSLPKLGKTDESLVMSFL